jgi:biotin synthase
MQHYRKFMAFQPTISDLLAHGSAQDALHEQAAEAASQKFERQVFVRGVVEVSNFCRENCSYCGMRRDNRSLKRTRARHDKIAEHIIHHRPAVITDVNLQTGEDPVAAREVVLPLVRTLRRETDLGLSVCLGTLDTEIYAELKAAGATVYILKFETAVAADYEHWQAPGKLGERLHHIRQLAADGWNVSSGFIAGLPGQDAEKTLANCRLAASLPLDGCSVSPFIPGEATPLAAAKAGDVDLTLNCMAVLRLMCPGWLIPAVSALNLAQTDSGYIRGLRAGANVVTINLTPRTLQRDYLLYKRERFIMDEARALAAITAAGLEPSMQSMADYFEQNAGVSAVATTA